MKKILRAVVLYGVGLLLLTMSVSADTRILEFGDSLNFGNVNIGESVSKELTLYNRGDSDLTIEKLRFYDKLQGFYSGNFSGIIPPNGEHNVTITFHPEAGGIYNGLVYIESDRTNSGDRSRLLSGVGVDSDESVATKILKFGENLEFGEVKVGESATKSLTLYNQGNRALHIEKLYFHERLKGKFSGDFTGDIPAHGEREIAITFSPTEEQSYAGLVYVESDRTNQGDRSQLISGKGIPDDGNSSIDTIKPVITLVGEATVTLTVGDSYSDAGATASDDVDGDITSDINVTSTVDTTTAGTYSVKYNVKDSAGNVADEVSRVVIVNEIVAIETGSLVGRVLDISGNAISNATIQVGSLTRSSDANGNFSFNELNVSNRVIVNASKADYLNNSKIVQIQKDLETTTTIVLAQESGSRFSSSDETTVEGSGGGALTLPADIYVDREGNSFSGEVELSLNYYPISTPQGREMFPGNFDAINSANERGTLRSYGFVTMSLQDSSGNPLGINGRANITIPADLSLGTPPATIPLWYYDEDRGIWVEDGVATYDEATQSYQGAITRIAVYNLDVFMNSGNLKVCVEDINGTKLSGAYVRLENPSTNWFSNVGPTNSTGYMNILNVMGNINLNLSAYLSDGRYGIYNNNPVVVTPSVNNELPSCIVVADGNATLTGVVQEVGTGTKLSGVKVVLRSGGVYLRDTLTNSNGSYSFGHLIGGLVYDLEYTKVAYSSKEQEDINLLANEDKDLALVEMVPIVIPNQPPVANAGVDKSVTVNQAINLVGTGTDSDGSIVAYEWKEGVTTLSNSASFDYTPTTVGEHNLTLTVTDDDGAVGSDGVTIEVLSISSEECESGFSLFYSLGVSHPSGSLWSSSNKIYRIKACHSDTRIITLERELLGTFKSKPLEYNIYYSSVDRPPYGYSAYSYYSETIYNGLRETFMYASNNISELISKINSDIEDGSCKRWASNYSGGNLNRSDNFWTYFCPKSGLVTSLEEL